MPLPSRAFSHARGHLRVSGVFLDGPRKRGTARSLDKKRLKPHLHALKNRHGTPNFWHRADDFKARHSQFSTCKRIGPKCNVAPVLKILDENSVFNTCFFIYCSLLLGDFCTENIIKKDWLTTEQTSNETLAKKDPGGTFLQI